MNTEVNINVNIDIDREIAAQKKFVAALELKVGDLLIKLNNARGDLFWLQRREWNDADMDLRNIPGG
jgi:hypothetical protein